MPRFQKSALPYSAKTRASRIRQYRCFINHVPKFRHEAPSAPSCPTPTHEPGKLRRRNWFDRSKLAKFKVKFFLWMRRLTDWIQWLTACNWAWAGVRPRLWGWDTRHWKPYFVALLVLAAIVEGRLAFTPHQYQVLAQVQEPKKQEVLYKPLVSDDYGAAAVIPSPNWDERPIGTAITTLVLHSTATATGQEAVNTFRDPNSRRSAHFLVDRNGAIIEMVPPERRAWHAGKSAFEGVPDLNNFSIGVEMVNFNDGQPYSDAQYKAVAVLIGRLRMHYNIPDDRIVSHAAVALPPGRKSDPLGFDFARLFADLRT